MDLKKILKKIKSIRVSTHSTADILKTLKINEDCMNVCMTQDYLILDLGGYGVIIDLKQLKL